MERDVQVVIGRRIAALIKKEVGEGFTDKYQGSTKGKVAVMVIIGSNVSFISKVKSYLWNHCHIAPEKIKGHGSGLETTIKIHLSEFKTEILTYIDDEYKRVFPECKSKVVEVKIETPVEIKAEVHRHAMSKLAKFRLGVSTFLNGIFEFENGFLPEGEKIDLKKLFNFSKERDESLQNIICKDEDTAIKIEQALQWLIDGNNPNIIGRTKAEIVVIYSELPTNLSRNHPGVNYCFPPSYVSYPMEINLRLKRIKSTLSPNEVIKGEDKGSFIVRYNRVRTASKIFEIINEMNWTSWTDNSGGLHIHTYFKNPPMIEQSSSTESTVSEPETAEDNIPSLSEIEVVLTSTNDSIEELPILEYPTPERVEAVASILKEVILGDFEKPDILAARGTESCLALELPGFSLDEPEVMTVGHLLPLPGNRKQVFFELNKLFLNKELFAKLSPETQDKVFEKLNHEFQYGNTEFYALFLMELLK